MQQKDIASIAAAAIFAAILSMVTSHTIFKEAYKSVNVPVVEPISSDFPEVKYDPSYTSIFYNGALDPTQLIQIGNQQNPTPFTGPQ